ncbi:hypothetical protein REH59_07495 [Pseudomonas sp. BO3-4]|uniref:hypothetical protein n=1 Tax=Pseudomonas sp. BO3-4 TaxID=3094916 RepID=UPI002A59E2FF|nr:hypothetical protein [Pseudomonas sp. BO3-4]WPO31481.1 hypothetical protein REH59_07495 [Pseudomonas sp. BO3-4]
MKLLLRICLDMSRNYRARKESVAKRAVLVSAALQQATDLRMNFEYFSDLAKFVASMVTDREFAGSRALSELANLPNITVRSKSVCYQTFLRKDGPYRRMLDEWWSGNSSSASINQAEHEYFLKYADACTTIHQLKDRLNFAEAQFKEFASLKKTASGRDLAVQTSDAYVFVENLLKEFQDFLRVEGGELVTNDSMRKVIATREMLGRYQAWRHDLLGAK